MHEINNIREYFFKFPVDFLHSNALVIGTSGSALCISVCLTSVVPLTRKREKDKAILGHSRLEGQNADTVKRHVLRGLRRANDTCKESIRYVTNTKK
jgi:hypothetical protein